MRKTMPLGYYYSNFKLIVSLKVKWGGRGVAMAELQRNQMLEGRKKEKGHLSGSVD